MQEVDFRVWLSSIYESRNGIGLAEGVRSSRVANCRTVERCEGDLDKFYEVDGLDDLIARLNYSTNDERLENPVKHKVSINGNLRTGSSTLKSAVKLYQNFKRDVDVNGTVYGREKKAVRSRITRVSSSTNRRGSEWPEWSLPNEKEILLLAKSIMPFVRFLHPDIIEAIAVDNEVRRESWCEQLKECGIAPDIYLWESSPCAFPGVRRHVGRKEIAQFKAKENGEQPKYALRLDDNDFPKQIWSFVFRGKQFQNFGPSGYSLAHLIDHKEYKNRCEEEFSCSREEGIPERLFGLYTSAANATYVPSNFLKPTDFNGTIRMLLQRKIFDLYGAVCNPVPPMMVSKDSPSVEWEVSQFDWAEPVGTLSYVEVFLEYRAEIIDDLFAKWKGRQNTQ